MTKEPAPKYIALYQQLKAEIISGKYPAGSFLPVEDKLVELYGASRTTLRHAISLLKEENLLDVRQGRGTEVLPVASGPNDFRKFRNTKEIFARFLVEGDHKISAVGSVVDQMPAEARIAGALGVEQGARVYRLQKLQTINDVPFAFMVHYLRPDILPGLERYNGQIFNLAEFVKKEYRIALDSSEETISIACAGFVESRMLDIENGTPLFAFHRVARHGGTPVEYGETLIRPDLFQIVVKMEGGAAIWGAADNGVKE